MTKGVRFVVAVSQKEADGLSFLGYPDKKDAEIQLITVKAPPTDPFYAQQYKIFKTIEE